MKLIPSSLTQTAGRQILKFKAGSPKTLFVAGIAGTVVSTVLACRATLKLEKTLEEFKHDVDSVNDLHVNENKAEGTMEHRKDLAYVYAKGTVGLMRLYGPSFLIGTASIAALTGSHVTLTRRNTALMAAYSAVSTSFDEYRQRVKDEFGEEKELHIRHGVTMQKQDGKGELQPVADPNKYSVYARFFDVGNANWQKNAEYNRLFIQCQQNYLNNLLQSRGHVFLNEAYDALGLERSQAGQVVGWVISDTGDNFIDFGMFEAINADFVNGWEKTILLDFNVDGVIYDKI